jgi:methionyl-tRNA synthetase
VLAVGSDANKYFTAEQPWALKKTDPARMGTVLYVTAEVLRQIAILLQPFIPASAEKLLDQLGLAKDERTFATLGNGHRLKPGTALGALAPVFPRYVEPENAAAE